MLIEKGWDVMTDEEMLIEMDDFGDKHTTIHEAAKRIRAKNDRIKDQAETIGEQKYQLQDADKAIAALEADADAVRVKALRDAVNAATKTKRAPDASDTWIDGAAAVWETIANLHFQMKRTAQSEII